MMSGLPWLRLYTEFASDAKVQSMSEAMQRRLIMLFCLKCSEQLNGLSEKELSFAMKISISEMKKTLKLFYDKGFLNEDGSLKNYDKRQRNSDHSKDRVIKFRDSSKNAALIDDRNGFVTEKNRYSNGFVTEQIRIDKTRQEEKREEERTLMSGKPDPEQNLKNKTLKTEAITVLNFLNQKTGRNYRPVETNLKMIVARLKSGVSTQDCFCVIAKKSREWKKDEKMEIYLRPKTLFNATNFEQYVGELFKQEEPENEL